MKRSSTILLLLCCFSQFVSGQKTRFGQAPTTAKPGVDYPLTMHISGIHIRTYFNEHETCRDVIYADAIMNANKIELMGTRDLGPFKGLKLALENYQARLVNDNSSAELNMIGQKYELVLRDKTVWRCTVTGISE